MDLADKLVARARKSDSSVREALAARDYYRQDEADLRDLLEDAARELRRFREGERPPRQR